MTAALSLAGCSTEPNGAQRIAEAAGRAQAALAARRAACGQDAMPLPAQALQPRMPERNTPACRDASFEYEKAMLDLGMTQHRFATETAANVPASAKP